MTDLCDVAAQFAQADQPQGCATKVATYRALPMLQEVWRLSGQPSGKYLAVVMDDTLERLVRFRELGKVAEALSHPQRFLRAIHRYTVGARLNGKYASEVADPDDAH